MGAHEFGFIRASSTSVAPATNTLVRASFTDAEPDQMPEVSPDGPALNNLDASTSFPALSSAVFQYTKLYIQDAVSMYNEYVGAASETNALVWLRRFNVKTALWETILATIQVPVVGETVGPLYKSFAIRFDGIGINTSVTGFLPGQQYPSSVSGLNTFHTYGRGAYGSGLYGY